MHHALSLFIRVTFLLALYQLKFALTKNIIPDRETNEYKLIRDLFLNYDKEVRPVYNNTDIVSVDFSLSLIQIVAVNSKSQLLTTSVWIRQQWRNPFLSWNTSDYGGIDSVNVDPAKVWIPDIILYNNADDSYGGGLEKYKTKVILTSEGYSQWFSPASFTSTCKINVKYFPFDKQNCSLKFGSWTYGGDRLFLASTHESADLAAFVANGEWTLIAMPAKSNKKYYNCCNYPFYDVTLHLIISRKPLYYVFNLIIPCALIATLTLIKFFLPPESGEKVGLGITVLLAMTVFLLLVADSLPSTSESIPLLGQYYIATMFDTALSLVATCMILNYFHRNPATSPMPKWVRVVILGYMSRVFCFWATKPPSSEDVTASPQRKKNDTELRNGGPGMDIELETPLFQHHPCAPPRSIPLNKPMVSRQNLNTDSDTESRFVGDVSNTNRYYDFGSGMTMRRRTSTSHSEQNRELTNKILEGINVLAENVRSKEEDERLREEWRYAALVLDRMFFWIFCFTTIFTTFLIFYQDAVIQSESEDGM